MLVNLHIEYDFFLGMVYIVDEHGTILARSGFLYTSDREGIYWGRLLDASIEPLIDLIDPDGEEFFTQYLDYARQEQAVY